MAESAGKTPFEIPNEMRDFAAKSLEQARRAVDSFMDAAGKAAHSAEQSAQNVRAGASDVAQHSMDFASQNVSATFEMMQRLVHARGPEDILRIQGEYMKGQIEALQEHARAVGSSMHAAGRGGTATKS